MTFKFTDDKQDDKVPANVSLNDGCTLVLLAVPIDLIRDGDEIKLHRGSKVIELLPSTMSYGKIDRKTLALSNHEINERIVRPLAWAVLNSARKT